MKTTKTTAIVPEVELRPRPKDVYVVFVAETEIKWLRFLKHGFRHCFIVMRRDDQWIVFDPLAHQLSIDIVHDEPGIDPMSWYTSLGHKVVPCTIKNATQKLAPVAPFTCVEAIKRVLGIHSRKVLTPWQLYQHLVKGEV
ncbi:MAG: hypothetical protein OQJ97_11120 [Rhodospirillales bacterium]|nr:hypothetical protein [Rhodospirillales bacterium]